RRGERGADRVRRRSRLCGLARPPRRQPASGRRSQCPGGTGERKAPEMTRWLAVIGIGEDGMAGLNPAALALVETAETLVGGVRHLAMVPPGTAARLEWRRPLADTIGDITARRGSRVAVLASGDPLWYGVGAVLLRHFRREEMTFQPQPGAFSLAASR